VSQVVVTEDALSAKRKESLRQEHKIDTESVFNRWRRNDITGRDPVAAAVGVLALPVVAFWSFVAGCITISVSIVLGIFRLLGKLFR
jgi:hypothetical protein